MTLGSKTFGLHHINFLQITKSWFGSVWFGFWSIAEPKPKPENRMFKHEIKPSVLTDLVISIQLHQLFQLRFYYFSFVHTSRLNNLQHLTIRVINKKMGIYVKLMNILVSNMPILPLLCMQTNLYL